MKLLERTTRRVLPTVEGESFLPVADRLVRDFDSAIVDLKATAERRIGHVTLAAIPSVASNLLPAIIKSFATEYPGIYVHLDDDNSMGVQRRVERNEVDMGIGGQWNHNSQLDFTPLFDDKLELVCHVNHPLAQKRTPVRWQQLDENIILHSGITRQLRGHGRASDSRYEFPNSISLVAMLQANIGVTVLPSLAIPRTVTELISRPLAGVDPWRVFLITRRESDLSPAAQAMKETLFENLPAQAQRLGVTLTTEYT